MLSGAVCQKNEQLVAGLARNRFRDTSRLALWDFFEKLMGDGRGLSRTFTNNIRALRVSETVGGGYSSSHW
jgi:hypothetical protein